MGTPGFAVPTLIEIVGRGHKVAAVYTRAPKPADAGWICRNAGRARGARPQYSGSDTKHAAHR
jgi:methionyl-tRNA formyltransferase